LWGIKDMTSILTKSEARGIVIWDLNDYFNVDYYNVGNPINNQCSWTNSIAFNLGWASWEDKLLFVDDICQNYVGQMPWACTESPSGNEDYIEVFGDIIEIIGNTN